MCWNVDRLLVIVELNPGASIKIQDATSPNTKRYTSLIHRSESFQSTQVASSIEASGKKEGRRNLTLIPIVELNPGASIKIHGSTSPNTNCLVSHNIQFNVIPRDLHLRQNIVFNYIFNESLHQSIRMIIMNTNKRWRPL